MGLSHGMAGIVKEDDCTGCIEDGAERMAAALTAPGWVSVGERRLLNLLRFYARRAGYAWVGQATLAKSLKVSVRTVQYRLARLRHLGLIERRRRGWGLTAITVVASPRQAAVISPQLALPFAGQVAGQAAHPVAGQSSKDEANGSCGRQGHGAYAPPEDAAMGNDKTRESLKRREAARRKATDDKAACGLHVRDLEIEWGKACERAFPADDGYPVARAWNQQDAGHAMRLREAFGPAETVRIIRAALADAETYLWLTDLRQSGVGGLAPMPKFTNFAVHFEEIRGALVLREKGLGRWAGTRRDDGRWTHPRTAGNVQAAEAAIEILRRRREG